MSALDRLKKVKQQANASEDTRALYSRFIVQMREQGWSDADVAEYAGNVKTLMGNDDQASLSLFPVGLFESAQAARESASMCWRAVA